MKNQLEQLKQMSNIVADTGDFALISQYRPEDVTTNPSLILKVAQMADYKDLVQEAITTAKQLYLDDWIDYAIDLVSVKFGVELSKLVPGYVSTEVNASLSFDTQAMVNKANVLLSLYEKEGVNADRVLIKLAATWEGIQAAKILEQSGVRCNLTLVFSLHQAVACAEAGAYLISPFVGRILDWYRQHEGDNYNEAIDPGVNSVSEIYNYLKAFGYPTIVMAASFRSTKQVCSLAGCDRLTISPVLLQALSASTEPVARQLIANKNTMTDIKKILVDEKSFRWAMNANEMAHDKLAEGIRLFDADYKKLCDFLVGFS